MSVKKQHYRRIKRPKISANDPPNESIIMDRKSIGTASGMIGTLRRIDWNERPDSLVNWTGVSSSREILKNYKELKVREKSYLPFFIDAPLFLD